MKVIFLKDIKPHGKKGEIKEVKDGFAQNYLIKNNLAEKLTESSLARLHKSQKEEEKETTKLLKEAQDLKKTIEDMDLEFTVNTGEDDKVFGSISSKQIKEELVKVGIDLNKRKINIEDNLSSLGTHIVKIQLHPKVEASLRITLKK